MKIRLSDSDRERLGCPEYLDGSVEHISMDEAEALEEISGLPWGQVLFTHVTGMRLRACLGMIRAGMKPEWDKLRFDLGSEAISLRDPGKAPSTSGGSPTSTTSSSSTPRTRRKPSEG